MSVPLLLLAGAALALVPIRASAQARQIVPKSMDGIEGIGGSPQPFGFPQPYRYQCIYNGEELPFATPIVMKALYARAEHSLTPPNDSWPQKQYLTISMLVSTSTARAENASTKFAENHGLDSVIVIGNANISLPAQPTTLGTAGVPAPRPCNVPLLFARPSFFDLTPIRTPFQQQPKSLVVEILILSQPNLPYELDSPLVCSSRIRWFGKQGARCVTSPHGQPLEIASDDSLRAGGSVTFTLSEIPPRNPFAVILGKGTTGIWKGQPLPVDLTLLGGYDCFINVDWVHTSLGVADAQGMGRVSFGIPSGRYVVGLELLAQGICQDISANPLLFSTSLGIGTTVCGPLGVTRLSHLGSISQLTGALTYGACMIFEVR